MRPKGPCEHALVLVVSAGLSAGASGLLVASTVRHRPVWITPYNDDWSGAEASVAPAALPPLPSREGGFLEDISPQWQYLPSLFARRGRGRLVYADSWPDGQAGNFSINSAGSIQDMRPESRPKLVALLLGLIIGLPVLLGCGLHFSERWAKSSGDLQGESDSHEGGSLSITMTGAFQAGSVYPGDREVKHQRLIAPYKTHDYECQDDDSTGIMLWLDMAYAVLVGLSTAMMTLLDAMSFSFFTGAPLLNSIWGSCIVCISTALVGGRPGMISSTSTATAVVLARVARNPKLGLGAMSLCVFIGGVVQILAAVLRLSRFITLIPHSVMVGCINGLAIMTLCTQLRYYHYNGDGQWISGTFWSVTLKAALAVVVAMVWSRIPLLGRVLPAPLVAVLVTLGFSVLSWLPSRTLGDIVGKEALVGGLSSMPAWDFPPKAVDNFGDVYMWTGVVSTAIRFALAGLVESLMTQSVIDEITGTSSCMRRECLGQGVGNVLASLFGTQGGGAISIHSFVNVGSGGRTRLSGFVTGALLGLSAVFLGPLVAELPAAAPLGLLAVASLNTMAWGLLELLSRERAFDFFVAAFVTFLTVWDDIAAAVVAGVIVSMLSFAWKVAVSLRLDSVLHRANERTFYLRGPLFFGSALSYRSEINPASIKEEVVILDFTNSRILDIAGIDAIEKTRDQLRCAGKRVVLQGLPPDAEMHLEGQARPPDSG